MEHLKVLAICGSLRRNSYNRRLLSVARKIAEDLDARVNEADLRELVLPLYNEDLERPILPEPVIKLKSLIADADLLLIASPEYNHSVSGVLKNAIDWASRSDNSFAGKVAVICGASDGPYGTARMQPQLRQILASLNVIVVPQPQVTVRFADKAFNPDGSLVDSKTFQQLHKLITRAVSLAGKNKI